MESWSDNYPWTEKAVITWVMIYWISQVTGGLRIYKMGNGSSIVNGYVHVPLGVSVFPKELFVAPEGNTAQSCADLVDWARLCGDLKFYRIHDSGGFIPTYK